MTPGILLHLGKPLKSTQHVASAISHSSRHRLLLVRAFGNDCSNRIRWIPGYTSCNGDSHHEQHERLQAEADCAMNGAIGCVQTSIQALRSDIHMRGHVLAK